MNGQTFTWSQDELYAELVLVRNQVDKLINKVLSLKPAKYGSDSWWEKMDQEGLEQIKQGKVASFKSVKALMKELNN